MSDPRPDAQKAREALDTIVHGDHHWTERGNVIAAYIDHAEAERDALRARVKELLEALEPIADDDVYHDDYCGYYCDCSSFKSELAERALTAYRKAVK